MNFIRYNLKLVSAFLLLLFLQSLVLPPVAKALTGGPSSPEVNSFEPVEASDMVDKFTGDFSYNIPLLQVGDYPVNIAYNSDIRMDQEATWVGLGWNINPGVMKRNDRGLPDDFKGDEVKKERSIKPNETYGMSIGSNFELIGQDWGSLQLGAGFGLFHNNYKGWGTDYSLSPTANISKVAGGSLSTSLNLDYNSQGGLNASPNISYSRMLESEGQMNKVSGSLGTTFNSREGFKRLTMGSSLRVIKSKEDRSTKNYRGSIGFATPTFTPASEFPWVTSNFNFRGTVGSEYFGGHPMINGDGYGTVQKLDKQVDRLNAYGYMYAHEGDENDKALMDFNRSKRGANGPKFPYLPVTNFTYDVFSASGQGVTGTYRPFRNDVGTVFDKSVTSKDNSASLGVEIGVGNSNHNGGDVKVVKSTSITGKWRRFDGNKALDILNFKGSEEGQGVYEPYYFGRAGEKNAIDEDYYEKLKEDNPIRVKLTMSNNKLSTENQFYNASKKKDDPIPGNLTRSERKRTTQPLKILNAKEAAEAALEKQLNSYKQNESYKANGKLPKKLTINRIDGFAKKHHISSITVIKPNGKRYVYGLPVYNTYQKETSFSVEGGETNDMVCNEGLVKYSIQDASKGNDKGKQNFFTSTEKPPYAHSYRLTAVLSPNYVDVTGNGISEDDLGDYTKFNYTRAYNDYKWRVPYKSFHANFNEGMKSITHDDKASYVYGTKQLWYLHSIESRNKIAEFYTSERADAREVSGEHGGGEEEQRAMWKLDSIGLYNKHDRKENQGNAELIKKVHFRYNYELCQGVPNNPVDSTAGGKLTLQKLYFTYGHSEKGELHPYEFDYDNANPKYNINGYDRWGRYKPSKNLDCGKPDENHQLGPADFPYVEQDTAKTNERADAWTMDKVHLPSGGTIEVEYESDDYAYVQNRRAMEMCKIIGTGDGPSSSPSGGQLYNNDGKPKSHLFVRLNQPVANYEELKQEYFAGKNTLDNLFIKALTDLKQEHYEFVPAYGKVQKYGLVNDTTAWLKLKKANVKEKAHEYTHPVSKQGWHLLRNNLPEVYNNKQGVNGLEAFFAGFINFASEFGKMFTAFEGYCQNNGYAQDILPDKSWVRLFSPYGSKLGGGSRVKKLLIKDEWGAMTGDPQKDYTYGKVYDYTKERNNKRISSGVASYEPMLGNEENPFRQPDDNFRLKHNRFKPGELHLIEKPIMESFFPAPSVGYSKVAVKNLPKEDVERTATGRTVHKFYTAKDFPTITNMTEKNTYPDAPTDAGKFLRSLFNMNSFIGHAESQGYVVELNDMHGKPKAEIVYKEKNNSNSRSKDARMEAESEQPILTKKRYHYSSTDKQPEGYQPGYKATEYDVLDNRVNAVNKKGEVETTTMGIDFQMVNDTRFERNVTENMGMKLNLDGFVLPFIPPIYLPLPGIYPSSSSKETVYKSIATTKVIKRHGIQTKTEVHDQGAKINKRHLAFDKETGQPLLTSTQNAFDDRIYNFTYPAHWKYDGMDLAYQNLGMEFKDVQITSGTISGIQNPESIFTPGDVILVKGEGTKIWAHEDPQNGLVFLDDEGTYADIGQANLKIIRSGHRNQPSKAIGKLETMHDPRDGGGNSLALNQEILNASAVQYSDKWQAFGGYIQDQYCDGSAEDKVWMKSFENLLNLLALNDKLTVPESEAVTLTNQPYNDDYQTFKDGVKTDSNCNDTLNDKYYTESDDGTSSMSLQNVDPDPGYYGSQLEFTMGLGDCCQGSRISTQSGDPIYFEQLEDFHKLRITGLMGCSLSNDVLVDAAYQGDTITLDLFIGEACNINFEGCTPHCHWDKGKRVNPYLTGILGRWHKKREYKFVEDRLLAQNTSGHTNIRFDGLYEDYVPFWQFNRQNQEWTANDQQMKWVWQNEVTLFGPYGNELENKDALDRYSAAIFGYNNQKPVAVAKNARYDAIAFEGFESFDFRSGNRCNSFENWNSTKEINALNRTGEVQHSGFYSLEVPADSQYLHHHSVVPKYWCVARAIPSDPGYDADSTDFIPRLDIQKDQKYLVQGWVKQDNAASPGNRDGYDDASIELLAIQAGSSYAEFDTTAFTFKPSGKVIEGWQRISKEFRINEHFDIIKLYLKSGEDNTTYFDDIRIQPFDGKLRSFVYNPDNLRLAAEFDENNFATFYEYDRQGNLTRVKKETTRGIKTIKEAREAKSKHRY